MPVPCKFVSPTTVLAPADSPTTLPDQAESRFLTSCGAVKTTQRLLAVGQFHATPLSARSVILIQAEPRPPDPLV